MPRLPTPFYKGLEGVSLALHRQGSADPRNSLEVQLPSWMVPMRRFCEVRISMEHSTFLIEVLHRGEYGGKPIVGHNAWQMHGARQLVVSHDWGRYPFHHTTLLSRPLRACLGDEADIDALRKRLAGSPADHRTVHVRVTPEGFQLRLYRSEDAARGMGRTASPMDKDWVKKAVEHVVGHGNGCGGKLPASPAALSNRERFEAARRKAEAAKPRQEELDLGEVEGTLDGKPIILKNVRMTFESPIGPRPEPKQGDHVQFHLGFTTDGKKVTASILPPSQAPRWNTCKQSFIDEDGAKDIYAEYAKSLEFGTEHMASARRFIDAFYPEPEAATKRATIRRTAAFIRELEQVEGHDVIWTRDEGGDYLSGRSALPAWMGCNSASLATLFNANGLELLEASWGGERWIARWTCHRSAGEVFNELQQKAGDGLSCWEAALDDRTRAQRLAEHHLRKQYRYASGYGYRGTFADLARQMRSFHNRGGHAVDVHVTDAFNYRGLLVTEVPFIEINPQTEDKETDMQKIDNTTNETNPLLVAGQRIVKATFEGHNGAKDYAYYTDIDLAVGDFAVVVSPYGELYDEESKGYITTVKITSIDEDVTSVQKASKWIVQKVDLAGYRERISRIEELKTIDAKIKRATEEARKLLELEKLAELSPDLKALVARRLELTVGKAEEAPADKA